MARAVRRTAQFKRDYRLMKRRGRGMEKLRFVMLKLADEKPLETKYRDHPLRGNYVGRRECHIEPDWLLIYILEPGFVVFERTGTHSDLFK